MAVIKTFDMRELAAELGYTIYESFWANDEVVTEVEVLLNNRNQLDGTYEDGLGGTSTIKTTQSASRIEQSVTLKNYDYWDDGYKNNGTEKYAFTGSNLAQGIGSVSGFSSSENVTESHSNGWTETQKEKVTAQIGFDQNDDLIITKADYSSDESGKDGNYSWKYSGKYSFTGRAVYDDYRYSDDWTEFYLESSQATRIAGSWSGSEKGNGWSYSEQGKFQLDSASGVTFDAYSRSFSGTIDKLSFSSKETSKEGSYNYSEEHSFQSGGPIDSSYLNDSLEDFLEHLLAGNDKITGTSKQYNDLYGGAGDDQITGNKGDDDLYGGTGNDSLKGGAGNDWMDGGEGNDTLKGDAGDDVLYGGEGNDILDGGAGADWLIGDLGTDTLKGGSGADKFHFYVGDSTLEQGSMDTVSDFKIKDGDKLAFAFDFSSADVTIQLGKTDSKASYADLLSAANDSGARVFVGYTAADKKNGYAFADFDNDGSMDMAIKLAGITSSSKIAADSITSDYFWV